MGESVRTPALSQTTEESSRGDLEIMYVQVQLLLEWEALAFIAQDSGAGSQEGNDVDMMDMAEQATCTNSAAQKSLTIEEHWELRNRRVMRKIIMSQGPWYDEESTVAWEDDDDVFCLFFQKQKLA
jgi:hypothetical protein